jgi:hypothetical protein
LMIHQYFNELATDAHRIARQPTVTMTASSLQPADSVIVTESIVSTIHLLAISLPHEFLFCHQLLNPRENRSLVCANGRLAARLRYRRIFFRAKNPPISPPFKRMILTPCLLLIHHRIHLPCPHH